MLTGLLGRMVIGALAAVTKIEWPAHFKKQARQLCATAEAANLPLQTVQMVFVTETMHAAVTLKS